jgi:hypothetical protein
LTAFQKVLYRIPEVHIVLFDRILIYRVQSPQWEWQEFAWP